MAYSRVPWPDPADPAAAQRLLERFAALGPTQAGFAQGPGAAMLAAVGGGSPYLSDLALREPEVAMAEADAAYAATMTALAAVPDTAPRATIMAATRRAKRRVALIAALADIGGHWPLHRVTSALSTLAEATLGLGVRHLLRAAHDARELTLPHPAEPTRGAGLVVLGMGKLGARELNYSSDIDLVILYDPAAQPGRDTLSATFTRLARNLVAMMETRDADGYVFRTDLRLRPDPAATPPAMSLPAAIAYYESMGQNWERAAMIKARPVAGELQVGHDFLLAIRPFVWRRGLDFAAIADIHAMKRRIDDHRKTGLAHHRRPGRAAGRVIDRETRRGAASGRSSSAAQTLQLVWGGRDCRRCASPATAGAPCAA